MRRVVFTGFCVVVAAVVAIGAQTQKGTLNIYYVDTEGGQSTLFVGPSGESLLVDTGNAGERDLGRIVETLRTAGVTKIDHMWTTHFHGDHVGALLAAMVAGPTGHVMGVDMTPAMLEKARRNAAALGLGNVAFCEGYLESVPVADASVDLVISNGVLNLCPDKAAVLAEAFRVLRPGGRMQLSDIVVGHAVPEDAKADISLWTG